MYSNHFLIISGGSINVESLNRYIVNNTFSKIVAVDRGLESAHLLNLDIDYIVGDFDTVNQDILRLYKNKPNKDCKNTNNNIKYQGSIIKEYQPEKDMTDTQIAIEYAIENKSDLVTIFGATGTRIDHVLGNIALLNLGIMNNVKIEYIDDNNKIYMSKKSEKICKDNQYGKYVSVIPYGGSAVVDLIGMKYPLNHHRLNIYDSLGISNEIIDEYAIVKCIEGCIIIIESRD